MNTPAKRGCDTLFIEAGGWLPPSEGVAFNIELPQSDLAPPHFSRGETTYEGTWRPGVLKIMPASRAPFIDDPHLSLAPLPPAGHLWLYGFA